MLEYLQDQELLYPSSEGHVLNTSTHLKDNKVSSKNKLINIIISNLLMR